MSFDSLGLSPVLLRALADQKYNVPTAIQAAAIPVALSGRDLLASAQTGTGKTAAFVLPLLERLFAANSAPNNAKRRPRALILTPTRELAAQVHESLRTYARYLKVFSTTIYGGMSMGPQMDALRRGVDVLVATPGRLMDHMERRTVDLSGIEILVLDEADRMLDMGFLPAITRILGTLPKQRQTLLFSATFADEIKRLAQQFMRNPAEIQVAARNSIASTITHRVHPVDAANKRDLLLHILAQDSRRQTLVFSRTKHGADKLCKFLDQSGLRSAAIHGNKTQGARTRALKEFKTGKVTVLVATDIAARGLDIDQLPVVINYDLPMVAEDYIHRIGRTGRAGAEGLAVSLVAHDEARLLRDIRRLLKQEIAIANVEGYEPSRPLNLESNAAKPGQNGKPRNPNHARRPHTHNPNNKGHAAANKQHREWRGSRNARKA